ncbi:helix-turn-helix domain-containing protein [Actinomadura sp. NAK00032]|nr:helix-turn-helix domain-containing protein [Actinomadura sp. NAK00032]
MSEPTGRLGLELGASRRAPGGSTVQRIVIGAQLRRLREAHGISAEEAGYAIRGSQSKISRLELGRIGFKERDVADLLTLYGVTDEGEREALLELARQANAPAWWHQYSDVMPAWLETYIGLEEASNFVRSVESRYIPDILQTGTYARSLAVLEPTDFSLDDAQRQTEFTLRRQQLLQGGSPPLMWFLLDEAVLCRLVGGLDVMRDQLQHLTEACALPNITIQIIPTSTPRHENGPFTLLRFSDQSLSDIVFIEHSNSGLYLDRPSDVDWYVRQFNSLAIKALKPTASLELIADRAEHLDTR